MSSKKTFAFQTLISKKTLPINTLPIILENIACYLNCLPLEAALGPSSPLWSNVLQQLENFYRRIIFVLNTLDNISPLLKIMITVFKIPMVSQYRGILEPFSKVLSYAIQTNIIKYTQLVEVCFLCNRAFTKVRKQTLNLNKYIYFLFFLG